MLQLQTHYRDTVIADHTTCYIDDLCVDKRHRGKHIGAELYAAARDYAREKSCKDITLNVWTLNDGAMKFYEKLGLKPYKVGMEAIL
jgi:ribosomal protein S18 acetylase RimI-like enzyme